MHTSTSPQYAIIAELRRGRGHDGAARAARRWWKRASPKRSTSAARCARSRRSTARTGGSRSGARTSSSTTACGEGATTGCSRPRREVARLRRPGRGGFNMLDPIKSHHHHAGAGHVGQVRQDRHPGQHRHQVPGRARRGGREDGAVLVLHHVHHRHHQGPLEHAADRAAAVQGRLRPQRADVAHPAGVRAPRTRATSAWACAT